MTVVNNPAILAKFPRTVVFNAIAVVPGFQDLDLSAVVGARQAVVLISIVNNAGVNESITTRRNGETSNIAAYGAGSQAGVVDGQTVYFVCVTDNAGIMEWQNSVAAGTMLVTVEAFWYES